MRLHGDTYKRIGGVEALKNIITLAGCIESIPSQKSFDFLKLKQAKDPLQTSQVPSFAYLSATLLHGYIYQNILNV